MVRLPNRIAAGVASPKRPAFAAIGGHQRTTGSALTEVHRLAHDDGVAVGPCVTCS